MEDPPESVAVFGSAARGDGNVKSDIDVLIVKPNLEANSQNVHPLPHKGKDEVSSVWEEQTYEFGRQIFSWSGNRASLLQVTRDELVEMLGRGEPVADSIRKEARHLWGTPIVNLIDGEG